MNDKIDIKKDIQEILIVNGSDGHTDGSDEITDYIKELLILFSRWMYNNDVRYYTNNTFGLDEITLTPKQLLNEFLEKY